MILFQHSTLSNAICGHCNLNLFAIKPDFVGLQKTQFFFHYEKLNYKNCVVSTLTLMPPVNVYPIHITAKCLAPMPTRITEALG